MGIVILSAQVRKQTAGRGCHLGACGGSAGSISVPRHDCDLEETEDRGVRGHGEVSDWVSVGEEEDGGVTVGPNAGQGC